MDPAGVINDDGKPLLQKILGLGAPIVLFNKMVT